MTCRNCGTSIAPTTTEVEKPKTATSYEECNFVCPNSDCRIGYSDAKDELKRRAIYPDYKLNVPATPVGLREELPRMLAESINVTNRANKKTKFAFASSEDAITWVTFLVS